MESLNSRINSEIEYSLKNPSLEARRELACYAALDMSTGHILRDKRLDIEWYINNARSTIDSLFSSNDQRGIVDTTTLVNAFNILDPNRDPSYFTGGAIFDFATFLNAIVYEDTLVFLKNPEINKADINRIIEDLNVIELPWGGDDDFSIIVENAWGEAERWTPDLFSHPQWKDKHQRHWSTLCGHNLDIDTSDWPKDYREYFSSVDLMAVEKAVNEIDELDDSYGNILIDYNFKPFVVESSIRAVFYLILGNAIEANYYASSHRSRLKEIIIEATSDALAVNEDRLANHVHDSFYKDLSTDALVTPSVELPFILPATLSGIKNNQQLLEKINELRLLTKPLRKKRSELSIAIRNQDQANLHAIAAAITEQAKALSKAQYFLGHSIVSKLILSPGGARPIFGALGKLLLHFSKLPDNVQEILNSRLIRPELWTITSLSAQARRAINCLPILYDLLAEKNIPISETIVKENEAFLIRLAS